MSVNELSLTQVRCCGKVVLVNKDLRQFSEKVFDITHVLVGEGGDLCAESVGGILSVHDGRLTIKYGAKGTP